MLPVTVWSQENAAKLAQTEKDFAAWSVTQGTKDAFLKFMDSNAVVFDKGRPVAALPHWQAKEKRPGLLDWHPILAETSAAGDLGYTTGPWTFRMTAADTILASGYYMTVWGKDRQGSWKFLVDMGVSDIPSFSDDQLQLNTSGQSVPADTASLLAAEMNFNKTFATSPATAYSTFLSTRSLLLRDGHLPAVRRTEKEDAIARTKALMLVPAGHGMAASGDLAYVYGSFRSAAPDNYLHVWRREKDVWKLAIEVLPSGSN